MGTPRIVTMGGGGVTVTLWGHKNLGKGGGTETPGEGEGGSVGEHGEPSTPQNQTQQGPTHPESANTPTSSPEHPGTPRNEAPWGTPRPGEGQGGPP